jgi:hypothetical protein
MPLMTRYFKQGILNFPIIRNNKLEAQTCELGAILVSLVSGSPVTLYAGTAWSYKAVLEYPTWGIKLLCRQLRLFPQF